MNKAIEYLELAEAEIVQETLTLLSDPTRIKEGDEALDSITKNVLGALFRIKKVLTSIQSVYLKEKDFNDATLGNLD